MRDPHDIANISETAEPNDFPPWYAQPEDVKRLVEQAAIREALARVQADTGLGKLDRRIQVKRLLKMQRRTRRAK